MQGLNKIEWRNVIWKYGFYIVEKILIGLYFNPCIKHLRIIFVIIFS